MSLLQSVTCAAAVSEGNILQNFYQNFIRGCVGGVLQFEWGGQHFFPAGNSHTYPEGGESHGPNKLPRADGVPF